MELDKEWLKGYIEIIILSVLETKSMYGFLLSKEIKELSGHSFEMKESTLYLALKRLEKKELVSSFWSDNNDGGRRKIYKISPQGKIQYSQKRSEWEYFKQVIDIFLRREIFDGDKHN